MAGTGVNITDLFNAVQSNNESGVHAFIDAGGDVNITDNGGKTALFYAVQQSNNESGVRALIDAGADINRTYEGKTALFYAVQNSNSESLVHALIEKGNCFSNPRDSYGRTPIFYAMDKSLSLIRYLLQKKLNIHIKDNCNMSILSFFIEHCVTSPQAFYGRTASYISERIDLLLENRVKKNAVFETIMSVVFSKCPLLSYSAINGKTIHVILELAKTYITEERELKETKIDDILEMVGKMLDDKQLCGALMPKILDLLFELGADPNSSDSKGNTALHYATCLPFYGLSQDAVLGILRKLEEVGVTFNAKNHQNETPLLFCLSLYNDGHQDESSQCSVIKIFVEVCGFLLQNGSNVEDTTRKGDSVFHLILRFLQRLLEWYTNPSFDTAVREWVRFLETLSFNSVNKRVVNKVDANLNSPLHLWALLDPRHHCFKSAFIEKLGFWELSQKVFTILLKCGANFNARNENGETPVHLCTTWTAVNLLLDAGANPNDVDSFGRTPLLAAAKNKTFLKIQEACFYPDVELEPNAFWIAALEKGLDPWVVDKHGESVLSILIESGAVHLAIALIEVAQLGNYLQYDSIAASLLDAVCRDRSACTHWKINLVERILKSSKKSVFGNVKENSSLDLCFRNIMEASKHSSVDKIKQTVHWKISRLLLSYGAYCGNPDDIVKACPALGELLFEPVDLEVFMLIPWNPVVKRYQSILEKVSKGLESQHLGSFWYHQVPLQSGSFGMIFAGINEIDGREVAIKRIEKLRLQQPEDKREITHLTALADCEQVVRYLGFFEDRDFSYIVLELMEGNLNDYLNPDNNHYVPTSGIPLCKDLVQGLKYLHSQSILHRDLKPTNILYKIFPKLSLKIADFGLSRHTVGSTSSSAYGSLAGTRCWIAPEVLKSTNAHSRSSDVFSCGLILYYILSVRKHPFAPDPVNKSELQISNETEANILNGHHTEGWDDSLCPEGAHLIKQMLDSENSKRPSADKALDHPFFWTKQKKVNLLIAVGNQQEFECPRAKRKLPLTTVESDLELNFGTIVKPHGKWNDPGYVHMPAIYSEMMKKRKTPYDTKSVVELVRFIRNATVRVSESTRPQPIRKLLLEDFVFLEYFPNLVMEVYKAVTMDGIRREKGSDKRDHGWDQTRKEIKYAISKK